MTQRERVERALVEHGDRGVHSFDFYQQGLPRAAVVVCRLKQAGWIIDSRREVSPTGGQGCRYFLRAMPGSEAPAASSQTHTAEIEDGVADHVARPLVAEALARHAGGSAP